MAVKKKKKKISKKKKKIILVNILVSFSLIIIIILLGLNDIGGGLTFSYNEVNLTEDNFNEFIDVSIQGKLIDEMGRQNEYFDAVNVIGDVKINDKDYKCKDVTFVLEMNVDYKQYNGEDGIKEINHSVKLDYDCKYEIDLVKELDVIGNNPIYSYNIASIEGKILIPKK